MRNPMTAAEHALHDFLMNMWGGGDTMHNKWKVKNMA